MADRKAKVCKREGCSFNGVPQPIENFGVRGKYSNGKTRHHSGCKSCMDKDKEGSVQKRVPFDEIDKLRKQRDLTLSQLAHKSNVSDYTVQRAARKGELPISLADKLAIGMGFTLRLLYPDE